MTKLLPRSFYARDTKEVARDLLEKMLVRKLTNGPGKLTQAFAITNKEHKQDLLSGSLVIEEGIREEFEIISTTRIGVNAGGQAKLRFYIKGNELVSKR